MLGQPEVEQDAVRAGDGLLGGGQRADGQDVELGGDVDEQLAHEERVGLVVLDQEHAGGLVRALRAAGGPWMRAAA